MVSEFNKPVGVKAVEPALPVIVVPKVLLTVLAVMVKAAGVMIILPGE